MELEEIETVQHSVLGECKSYTRDTQCRNADCFSKSYQAASQANRILMGQYQE